MKLIADETSFDGIKIINDVQGWLHRCCEPIEGYHVFCGAKNFYAE